MNLPEEYHYLPADERLSAVFNQVKLKHLGIGSSVDEIRNANDQRVCEALADYLVAGIYHFIYRSETLFTQCIGKNALYMMSSNYVNTAYVKDPQIFLKNAVQLADESIPDFLPFNQPAIFPGVSNGEGTAAPITVVGYPPEFIVLMMDNAPRAMVDIAGIISILSDVAHTQAELAPTYMLPRAQAFQAEFILNNPGWQLDDACMKMIKKYPEGLESLRPEVRYTPRSLVGTFENATQN